MRCFNMDDPLSGTGESRECWGEEQSMPCLFDVQVQFHRESPGHGTLR